MLKKKIKEIDDKIKEEYPYEMYKKFAEFLFDTQFQLKYLGTLTAKKEYGEENCALEKEKAINSIKIAKEKLEYIKENL